MCIILFVGPEITSNKQFQMDQLDINLLRGLTKGSYGALLHYIST